MSWKENIMAFKNAIEVEEYHSGRYGAPNQKRKPKVKPTPEQVKKRNQYNKEKTARRKLRQYFDVNDYLVDYTYRKEERPSDTAEAKADFKRAMRIARKEYRKRGYELKWMRNIEVGTKNAWHIHFVVNRIPDTDIILKEAWDKGKVITQLLYEKGEFAELASYITKTPDTDNRLKESSYSTSRNLPLPEPEVFIHYRFPTWDEVKIPEGFYLDKKSFKEGVNPFTGYKYRVYTLLRIRRGRGCAG